MSFVVVRDFCSLTVRAHRCRRVSSSVHWRFVSYRFLALVCPHYVARFSEVFCKCSNALFASVKVGSEITENSLLSGSERRKRSIATLRWITLMNFCKLTVCHLYSLQTCKTSLEKHSVLLLTFRLSISKILVPPGVASHKNCCCYVIFVNA